MSGSNNNLPASNNTFQTILTKFKRQGLDIVDLVALSGKDSNAPACAMQIGSFIALIAVKLNKYITILSSPKYKNVCYNSGAIAKSF